VVANKKANVEADFAKEMQFPFDDIHFQEGMKSAIRLPLFAKGAVFGTLNFNSSQSDAYGEREQEILEEFTGQIATAIKNDMLLTEAKQRIDALEIAYRQLADKARATAQSTQEGEEA
jgi:GAF domain-containing protein